MRSLSLLTLAVAGALASVPAAAAAPPPAPVHHVWVIVLENQNESTSFGASSAAPYLARTLPAMGQLVPNYFGIGHESNDNYLALISGQGPNPTTQADSAVFSDVQPGTPGPNGQAMGVGAVYPPSVQTVAGQLTGAGQTWKAYQEDMGNDRTREAATCAHPALNSPDRTQTATATDGYATRHDPFVYFHSIIDSPICQQAVVPLTRMTADLRSTATTPNFSFITPNLCHDGHDAPCANGEPGGLSSANAFLSQVVPEITGSAAFRQDGLLVVAFDESASGAQSCCGEDQDALPSNGANTANPGGPIPGTGGGQVGAVLVSPFITPGSVNPRSYNHYSLLASLEDLFGLPHLGFAGVAGLPTFGADVFSRTSTSRPGGPVSLHTPRCAARSLRGEHGTLRRGSLIASARVEPRGRRRILSIVVTRAARLDISVRRGGARRRVAARAVRACRVYRIALPGRGQGGTLRVQVSVRGARERRILILGR